MSARMRTWQPRSPASSTAPSSTAASPAAQSSASMCTKPCATRFVEGLAEAARAYRLGDPLDPETSLGPMATPKGAQVVRRQVQAALAAGAASHCRDGSLSRRHGRGPLCHAAGADRRRSRHGGDARGDLRARNRTHEGRRRRGSAAADERQRLRPRCLDLDARPRAPRRTRRRGSRPARSSPIAATISIPRSPGAGGRTAAAAPRLAAGASTPSLAPNPSMCGAPDEPARSQLELSRPRSASAPAASAELPDACRTLGIVRPLLVTDPALAGMAMVREAVAAAGAGPLLRDPPQSDRRRYRSGSRRLSRRRS